MPRFGEQYRPPGDEEVSESSVSEPDIWSPLSTIARSKSDELVDARYGDSFFICFDVFLDRDTRLFENRLLPT